MRLKPANARFCQAKCALHAFWRLADTMGVEISVAAAECMTHGPLIDIVTATARVPILQTTKHLLRKCLVCRQLIGRACITWY
jgi:hypothetical protein